MIHIRLMRVLNKEHITDESHQAFANPQAVLIALSLEGIGHQPLCAIVVLQTIETVSPAHQEMVTNIGGMDTEETVYQGIVDKRARHHLLAEGQSEVLYLVDCQR